MNGGIVFLVAVAYLFGVAVFWRNITFSQPMKGFFCLSIFPLFFGGLLLNLWLIDSFLPGLMGILTAAGHTHAPISGSGTSQQNLDPLINLGISTPMPLLVSYGWFALLRNWDHVRKSAAPVTVTAPAKAATVSSPLRAVEDIHPEKKSEKIIDVARAIVSVPRNKSAWNSYIANSDNSNFVVSDHGDEVDQWNTLAGVDNALVLRDVIDGEEVFFTYKGKTVKVPTENSREDNIIAIHSLSQLVKADSEIRYCVDCYGMSELYFLAMSPTDWAKLESEFGSDSVSFQFMALPEDLEHFWTALNQMDDMVMAREYNAVVTYRLPQDVGPPSSADRRGVPDLAQFDEDLEVYKARHRNGLKENNFDKRVIACWGLIAMGSDALAWVREGLLSPNDDYASDAAGVLAWIGVPESWIPELRKLADQLQDSERLDALLGALPPNK